jgi:rubrerythrin
MIRLHRSLIKGLDVPSPTPQTVRDALQNAVKLEHATIPIYLYGLYSLAQGTNVAIGEILQSVVVEEMLHMTLASNVLNALGGSPQIDQPGFIPTYPGPLPGGVESSLTVALAPFSMAQLEIYLSIEEPENPLQFPTAMADNSITIGEFYTRISKAIGILGNGAFVNPPRNQVGPDLMDESIIVTDVPSAQHAIEIIIEQGEGTRTSPEAVVGPGYAHYYRFMQIKKQHFLVKTPAVPPGYAYAGAPLSFDPSGVYNVPPSTSPSLAADNFNYTYTSLLGALHVMFNGQNNQAQFNRALGLMMSLKGQATAMLAGIPNPAAPVGPSFVYQPVNPETPDTAIASA